MQTWNWSWWSYLGRTSNSRERPRREEHRRERWDCFLFLREWLTNNLLAKRKQWKKMGKSLWLWISETQVSKVSPAETGRLPQRGSQSKTETVLFITQNPQTLWQVADPPIVSDCGSESYRIAEYIDFHLNPLSTKHRSYLKDPYDFVRKIKTLKIPPEAFLFLSGCRQPLYQHWDTFGFSGCERLI